MSREPSTLPSGTPSRIPSPRLMTAWAADPEQSVYRACDVLRRAGCAVELMRWSACGRQRDGAHKVASCPARRADPGSRLAGAVNACAAARPDVATTDAPLRGRLHDADFQAAGCDALIFGREARPARGLALGRLRARRVSIARAGRTRPGPGPRHVRELPADVFAPAGRAADWPSTHPLAWPVRGPLPAPPAGGCAAWTGLRPPTLSSQPAPGRRCWRQRHAVSQACAPGNSGSPPRRGAAPP